MAEKLLSRGEVPEELTWDLSLIYKSEELMWNDLEECKRIVSYMEETYKGHLDTPENVVACMEKLERLNELVTLIGNYTSLAVSVDYYDGKNLERDAKVNSIFSDLFSRVSFVDSEIVLQDDAVIEKAIELAEGTKNYLKNIIVVLIQSPKN